MNSEKFVGRLPFPATIAFFVVFPLLFLGCGSRQNDAQFQVSGTVEFQGQPVPAGTIKFSPLNQTGQVGYAAIKNGVFDTSRSSPARGVDKGSYRVEVLGFVADPRPLSDDDPESGGIPNARPLFTPHRFEHNFSSNEELQIVVPGELAIRTQ